MHARSSIRGLSLPAPPPLPFSLILSDSLSVRVCRLSKPSAIYQLRRLLGASQDRAAEGLLCGDNAIHGEPGPPVREKHKRMRNALDC